MKNESKDPRDLDASQKEDDHTCTLFLRKLTLTQDRLKRLKIIKAYARLNTRLAGKILVEALSDPCEEIRDYLIRELGEREQFDLSLALPRLLSPPWYTRSAILKVLGLRKSGEAVKYIELTLDDSNVDVRKSAAEALGEIGGSEALRLLVRLKKDRSHYVCQAAEQALRKASEVRFS